MSDVIPRVQDIGGCQWRRVESADTGLWVWAAECVGDTAEPAFGVWRWHGALDTWHVSYYYTRVIWNTRVWSVNNKWCCKVKWRMWFLWPAGKSWQSSSGGVHRIDRDIVRIHVFGKIMRVLLPNRILRQFWRETVTWPLPRLGLLVSEKTVRGP